MVWKPWTTFAARALAGVLVWFGALFVVGSVVTQFDPFWESYCLLSNIPPSECLEMYPYHLYTDAYEFFQLVFVVVFFSPIILAVAWTCIVREG